ncbi:MAG: hypothetical protein ACYTBJ_02190 [Planctomycetota bacterium]
MERLALGLMACLVAALTLTVGGCRIDADYEGETPDAAACSPEQEGYPYTCCEPHQETCTEGGGADMLVWCCAPFCPAGCTGGGCGSADGYCQGCFCPEDG